MSLKDLMSFPSVTLANIGECYVEGLGRQAQS